MDAVVLADAPHADVRPYFPLMATAALLIAADGGARWCLEAHILPHVVIGDLDSLALEAQDLLTHQGVAIVRYPQNKDETDLELALLAAVERGAHSITILGALGGRPDMHLANQLLLAHQALAGLDVCMKSDGWVIRLLQQGSLELTGTAGKRVSLIPVCLTAVVSTEGLRYALRQEQLIFGPARGVSNEFVGSAATITVHEGMVLVMYEEALYAVHTVSEQA